DGGGGMPDAEGVVLALLALRERRDAAGLLHRANAVAATGQDLVRVGLVADVPDDAVVRGVVQVVQGGGQLDHAQAGAEVAAGMPHALDQVGTQFVGDRAQLGRLQAAQVGGGVDRGQQRVALRIDRVGACHCGIFAPAVAGGKASAVYL